MLFAAEIAETSNDSLGFFVFLICCVMMIFCLRMFKRNEEVYKLRMGMIAMVHEFTLIDIMEGEAYEWRWERLGQVSYEEMMIKFWKPVKPEAFYSDLDFLKEPNGDI